MKWTTLGCLLFVLTNVCFALQGQEVIGDLNKKNTHFKSNMPGLMTNLPHKAIFPDKFERTIYIPTHVIRMNVDLSSYHVSCDEACDKFEEFFFNQLEGQSIFGSTFCACEYAKKHAKNVSAIKLDAVFDPITDEAVNYFQQLVNARNGQEFFGVPFLIEEAEGVVSSLTIETGLMNEDQSEFKRLWVDNRSHYFTGYYEMMKELVRDVTKRFDKQDPELVIPFYKRWLGEYVDYTNLLKIANYVEISPYPTYIMKTGARIYQSNIITRYINRCQKYPNQHCL